MSQPETLVAAACRADIRDSKIIIASTTEGTFRIDDIDWDLENPWKIDVTATPCTLEGEEAVALDKPREMRISTMAPVILVPRTAPEPAGPDGP